jgi:poly-gamma-glutamate synthesis protein (capsule biosynthesis protein)
MSKKTISLFFGVSLLIVIASAILIFVEVKHQNANKVVKVNNKTVIIPKESLTSSMTLVGEVFWGRAIQTKSLESPLKYAFPFSGLSKPLHDSIDNWVGDMECPVTYEDVPYEIQVDDLRLNCRPEFLSEAAKWFNVLSLANNHSLDNGQSGLDETRANLQKAGIQYFGDYNVSNIGNICEVVGMNAELSTGNNLVKKVVIPVAMCGYMLVVDQEPTTAELAVMSQYAKVMPVIAMPHMGVEYRPTAEPEKVQAYRSMIDNGADVVIGAHPHVIQNSENYKGRLIQYSVGNFLFDQQSLGLNNIVSLGVELKLTINDPAAIAAYTKIGPQCITYKNNCLAELQGLINKRPIINVQYAAQCFTEPNYYPVVADNNICNLIKSQANWDSAVSQLSSTW